MLSEDNKEINKPVLDACCGSRMMWFDKENPETLFMDIRNCTSVASNGRVVEIKPDFQGDFRNMPFPDNHFKLVVFDPPHRSDLGKNSWMAEQYGKLLPSWEDDIKAGFDECIRVLEPYGILIFKWNEKQIKTSKIIDVIGRQPLFGHTSGKTNQTIWMTFMKAA